MSSNAKDSQLKMRTGIQVSDDRIFLTVDNIKCGGCANTITHALEGLGFSNIQVSPEAHSIEMSRPTSESQLEGALVKLRSLGYPLVDTEEGLQALALKAKSFVSCAIGKLDK